MANPINLKLRDDADRVKAILCGAATGPWSPETNTEYKKLRDGLINMPGINAKVPAFVRSCRELGEFWSFIKPKFGTYKLRREFLQEAFDPLLTHLESMGMSPSDFSAADHLEKCDYESVQSAWMKALERRNTDPEGAITIARTLLESTMKHLLDEIAVTYDQDADVPKLYSILSKELRLAPSQHTEAIFKQVLGGCNSIVIGLGSIRSKLGDAHGNGRGAPKPSSRHAELAVNVSGAVATFLIRTFDDRQSELKKLRAISAAARPLMETLKT